MGTNTKSAFYSFKVTFPLHGKFLMFAASIKTFLYFVFPSGPHRIACNLLPTISDYHSRLKYWAVFSYTEGQCPQWLCTQGPWFPWQTSQKTKRRKMVQLSCGFPQLPTLTLTAATVLPQDSLILSITKNIFIVRTHLSKACLPWMAI